MNATGPSGTVTFLFTDIEGSTRLAQEHPDRWEALRKRHHGILRSAISANNGYVFHIIGDAFCVAFHTPTDASNAAVDAQRCLQSEDWGGTPVRVRMGIHTGEAELQADGDYQGYLAMCRVQRLMSAGHGGQVLLSQAAHALTGDTLPAEVTLRDLGEKRLKDLSRPEHLYQVVVPGLPADFPPLKTLEVYRHNLPLQMTSFIGREKEIEEIKQAISRQRLVTLTGSGGTGKTRLSLQAAADLLDSFPDGVWLVELAALSDPELIPQTILSILGNTDLQGRSALKALADSLRDKRTLIILDNCEHLIAAAAQVSDVLLNAAPDLKILASSREALGVKGELSWHVPSLSLPDPKKLPALEQLAQYEAVRLFTDRASLVNPHFTVSSENAAAVAQVCCRLDGIPLALELAAARVKMLSVAQIAGRLDDRFRLLTGGARTALPRQQTLRAMIDWSYDLLSEAERLLLRRLSVFAGGWTLELAEQVCSDDRLEQYEILDMLGKLVDKSLVAVVESAETRYRMLETVRQYAREKLLESGEGQLLRDQHLKAFVELAERAEPEIRGVNQLVWLNRLEDEVDNLRAALEWSSERQTESCVRLAAALWRFWDLRAYGADALEWFPRSIQLSEGLMTTERARLLSRASAFYRNLAQNKKSVELAREASALARKLNDKESLALALNIEGGASLSQPETARPLLEEGLRISEELGDHWLACVLWYGLAGVAERQNDDELRRFRIEKGLEEARLSKDHRRISVGLANLAFYYQDRGEFSRAGEIVQEGLALAKQIGDRDNVAERSLNLANILICLEEYSEAEPLLIESRRLYEEIGQRFYLGLCSLNLAMLAWVRNDIARFMELTDEALKIAKQTDILYVLAPVTAMHGLAALLGQDYQLAREELKASIHACRQLKVNWYYTLNIACFGMLALAEGQMERAAQIFAAYEQLAPSLPADIPFLVRKVHEDMALVQSKLGNEAFAASVNRGKSMSLEQTLAFVLGELPE